MKRIIILTIIFLAFTGGNIFPVPVYNIDPPVLKARVDNAKKEGWSETSILSLISCWVYSNIRYVTDMDAYGFPEVWKTPLETYNDRSGDCEDLSLLFAYFANRYLGGDPILKAIQYVPGGKHMIAIYNDYTFYLDNESSYRILKIYTYEEVLMMAEGMD